MRKEDDDTDLESSDLNPGADGRFDDDDDSAFVKTRDEIEGLQKTKALTDEFCKAREIAKDVSKAQDRKTAGVNYVDIQDRTPVRTASATLDTSISSAKVLQR